MGIKQLPVPSKCCATRPYPYVHAEVSPAFPPCHCRPLARVLDAEPPVADEDQDPDRTAQRTVRGISQRLLRTTGGSPSSRPFRAHPMTVQPKVIRRAVAVRHVGASRKHLRVVASSTVVFEHDLPARCGKGRDVDALTKYILGNVSRMVSSPSQATSASKDLIKKLENWKTQLLVVRQELAVPTLKEFDADGFRGGPITVRRYPLRSPASLVHVAVEESRNDIEQCNGVAALGWQPQDDARNVCGTKRSRKHFSCAKNRVATHKLSTQSWHPAKNRAGSNERL